MPDLSAPAGDDQFYFFPPEDPETAVQRISGLVVRSPWRQHTSNYFDWRTAGRRFEGLWGR